MYRSPPPAPLPPPPPTRDLNGPFPNHQMSSSGLLLYRSAPSSLLGEVSEDFLPIRAPSPETETMFARFLSPESPQSASASATTAAGTRNSQFPPPLPAASATSGAAAEENSNRLGYSSTAMIYQHQNPVTNQQMAAMEADQMKNSSNLIRQSSSPAGLFSHLNVENGYGVMRGINTNSNEGGGRRLKSQLSFSSSRQSSLLSQISEIENESSIGGGYPLGTWEESPLLSPNHFSSLSPLKRPRVDTSVSLVTENGELRNGLTHQFSMPKTSSEIAAIDKFLQFQDSVPCKIRAKRGCATHPRSIAERVRRTRISERMRKLQELVPNMDKQTNTADMLDLAVDYIKDLQKQVKTISDGRASCTCSSSKHKPYTNPTV